MTNKNNKGFTLIELLAVILILGIIALIAVPTVNAVIEQARKGAAETSIKNVISAIETNCAMETLANNEVTHVYIFNEDGITPHVDIKGSLPDSGMAKVTDECKVSMYVTSGNYMITKDYTDENAAVVLNTNITRPLELMEYDRAVIYENSTLTLNEGTDETAGEIFDMSFWGDGHAGMIATYDENNKMTSLSEIIIKDNISSYSDEEIQNQANKLAITLKNYAKSQNVSNDAELSNTYFIYDNRLFYIGDTGDTITSEEQTEYETMLQSLFTILYDFK